MYKRGLTILLTLFIALLLAAGGAISYVAVASPFRPGDRLFPLQYNIEQARLFLVFDQTELAERFLDLAERRLEDLEARLGSEHELVVLRYLDEALGLAALAVDVTPPEHQARLLTRLATLAANVQLALRQMTLAPALDPEAYATALARARALVNRLNANAAAGPQAAATGAGVHNPAAPPGVAVRAGPEFVAIAPHGVPFPPNATPGTHESFPLTGRHAALACADCHANAIYRGTASQCVECHAQVEPADHYPGSCALCHATAAWTPASFNHEGATQCLDCHLRDRPPNHYEGQCSLCHSTASWRDAVFNHSVIGATDCAACHTPPLNHFPGACRNCHVDTGNWQKVKFDHSVIGGRDCAECHLNRQPPNHFGAPCSRCHTDTGNWRNARFDHSVIGGRDCAECHLNRQPPNHFGAPCSRCHTDTAKWKHARFDHSTIGATDCSACHAPPPNHFPGACRDCHTDTSNWKNSTFRHTFPIDHHGANGDCAKCHPGNNYTAWTCTACHNQNKMDDKHREIPGYTPNCMACHANGRNPKD